MWFKRNKEQPKIQPDEIPLQETCVIQNPTPSERPYICGCFEISPTAGGWAITKYFGFSDETSIIIPGELDGKKIVKIGASTFENCKGLNYVEFADGVTEISGRAFYGCTNLSVCRLPKTLESIGCYAFGYTRSLTSLKLPNELVSMSKGCFVCSGLETITIPSGIKQISERTFSLCENLRTVELPRNLNTIEDAAFGNCKKLKTIAVPEGTKAIMPLAFFDCCLERIAIPPSVIRIGRQGINGQVFGNKTEQAYHEKRSYDSTLGLRSYGKPVVYCEAGSLAMEFARWNGLECHRYADYWM